ncbi:MAG: CopG family transcriptional regulator [Streptococcus hyovaginalis]|nr:CopG family transcriptional regulator [Streptococcus hyovaginalis]
MIYLSNLEGVLLMSAEGKSRVTVALANELNERLRKEAKERGLSITTIVTLALEDYFKK